eukprot:g18082.t1
MEWFDADGLVKRLLFVPVDHVVCADQLLLLEPGRPSLFSRASLAFGVHGAGFANVLWMSSGTTAIELMCSMDTVEVRGCFVRGPGRRKKPRPMTWWRYFGGAPWLRYFVVLLRRYQESRPATPATEFTFPSFQHS